MSYVPGFDGPPVQELAAVPENGYCCSEDTYWARDRYYANRWPDDSPTDCYVWTHGCGTSYRGPDL